MMMTPVSAFFIFLFLLRIAIQIILMFTASSTLHLGILIRDRACLRGIERVFDRSLTAQRKKERIKNTGSNSKSRRERSHLHTRVFTKCKSTLISSDQTRNVSTRTILSCVTICMVITRLCSMVFVGYAASVIFLFIGKRYNHVWLIYSSIILDSQQSIVSLF